MNNPVVKPVLAQPVVVGSLVTALVIFFLIGLLTKSRIHSIYSKFWRAIVRDLAGSPRARA